MIEEWVKEIKRNSDFRELGMLLIHNGVVRATSKNGETVSGMLLSYDREKLDSLIKDFRKREGIVDIRAWINEGRLNVGDDIMYVLVAGKLRTNVFPVLEELVSRIKKEIVSEAEFS
ncbi:MAG: molybdenum cofactor biosynthesis protein MoaE [Nitrospirota bacterium]